MPASQLTDFISSLEIVDLTANVCIDDRFEGKAEVQKMTSQLESHCKLPKINSQELFCEQVLRCSFGICCDTGPDANIDSQEYRLVSRVYPRIQSLVIRDYKRIQILENVHFLPKANDFIRNLIYYEASRTSVKTIVKENFEGMIWLERLSLHDNSIETLQKNTFQGLSRLRTIILSKNRTKYLSNYDMINICELQN